MKKFVLFSFLLFFVGCHSLKGKSSSFDRALWVVDFEHLKKSMGEAYPNFDVAEANGLNLSELAHATKEKLDRSNSDAEAFGILEEFVREFKDGHFRLEKKQEESSPDLSKAEPLPTTLSGHDACHKLMAPKYKNLEFQFPMPTSMGFSKAEIQGQAFPTNILKLGKQNVGFLRISSFGQGNYPDLCVQEWEKMRKEGPFCDGKCQETFVYRTLPNRLLHELENTVLALKKSKVSSLVVDLTGNGGGTDWVGAAIRMLTSKKILCGQFGFLKHPHWTKHFSIEVDELKTRISKASNPKQKADLVNKLQMAKNNLQQSSLSCDRSNIWSEGYKPNCSLVVKQPVLDCKPSDEFRFREGVFNKRLYILANRKTASAAEDMVARYKESGAATILGEKTLGSGCGYVDGVIPVVLPHSKIKVIFPNCVRYSRQGINEVLGIKPNVVLPMQDIKSDSFTESLVSYLRRLN